MHIYIYNMHTTVVSMCVCVFTIVCTQYIYEKEPDSCMCTNVFIYMYVSTFCTYAHLYAHKRHVYTKYIKKIKLFLEPKLARVHLSKKSLFR